MNLQRFISTECINYKDERCLNVGISDDLRQHLIFGKAPDKCVVLEEKPCPFLEGVIFKEKIKNENKELRLQDAIEEYNKKIREGHERRDPADGLDEGGVVGERIVRTPRDEEAPAPATERERASIEADSDRRIRRIVRRDSAVGEKFASRRRGDRVVKGDRRP